MKVEVLTLTEEAKELRDYRDSLTIKIDNEEVFQVYDGELEDNFLSRNFRDCYRIDQLMKLAYEAGKRNEELIFEMKEVEEL